MEREGGRKKRGWYLIYVENKYYVFFFDMFLLLNENYDNLVKLFIIDN